MPEAKGGGPALRYTKDGAIAWIAADNPARMNALTASMWQAIPDAISAATSDSGAQRCKLFLERDAHSVRVNRAKLFCTPRLRL